MQQDINLEHQEPQPIDEATKTALEQARAEMRRGEGVTLEEARDIVRKQHQIWSKTEKEVLSA